MREAKLQERLLDAWIGINGIFKNSKVTCKLTYNEAIIMRMVYARYCEDGKGIVPVQTILRETNMLKSLANRTIDALCSKGFVEKVPGEEDRRSVSVKIMREAVEPYESMHEHSIELATRIIEVIGTEDAEAFTRCYDRLKEEHFEL